MLIKVIWHEMSKRELGFGSQTINSNLLRLVQLATYSFVAGHSNARRVLTNKNKSQKAMLVAPTACNLH